MLSVSFAPRTASSTLGKMLSPLTSTSTWLPPIVAWPVSASAAQRKSSELGGAGDSTA